jgi:hypothetical protein
MDTTLITGIIGGICTIAAVIITPMAEKYFGPQTGYPISNDRRKILQGTWTGVVSQCLAETTVRTLNVDLDLNIKGRKIQGTGILNTGELLFHVVLNGSFRNDRFLKMDYQNKDVNVVQFGSFVFHLSDDSKELIGRFVGYGQISRSIVYGSCQFKKT